MLAAILISLALAPGGPAPLSRRSLLAMPFAAIPTAALAFQLPSLDKFSDAPARALFAARPNPTLSVQQQAAFFAITNNDLLTLRQMIDQGWDLTNAVDSAGKTSMHRAAQLGNTAAIDQLIKAGVPIDPNNTWKETPLHLATRNGRVAAVKQLVGAGASVSTKTVGGDNALSLAQKYRMKDIAEFLAAK